MTRAVLSIGSNIGDRWEHLQSVVNDLAPHIVSLSPVYRTPPWGPVEQDDFLNAVLIVDDPDTDARGWLARGQRLEQTAERVREVRWGPRTLDVDVVAVDGVVSDDPVLTLPHPRAHERAFVLIPWQAADPSASLAGTPVAELVESLPADERDAVTALERRLELP